MTLFAHSSLASFTNSLVLSLVLNVSRGSENRMIGLTLAVLISSIPALVWTKCPDKCTCSSSYLPSFANLPEINGAHLDCRKLNLSKAPTHFNHDTRFMNLDENNIPELEVNHLFILLFYYFEKITFCLEIPSIMSLFN